MDLFRGGDSAGPFWVQPVKLACGASVIVRMVASVLILILIVNKGTASAYCPPNHLCDAETVGLQTAGTATMPNGQVSKCDTMNGGALSFGTLTPNSGQSVVLRACVCPTDAFFSFASQTGIRFLGINLNNAQDKDFKILDSGVVRNGTATQVPGSNGCLNQDFSDTGNGYPGCAGNPSTFCYADIQFQPVEYGDFQRNITFAATCPGVETNNNPPQNCIIYPPGAIFDYQVNPIKLTALTPGFFITQPGPSANFPLTSPTSITDPGVSPSITLAASAANGTAVKWTTSLRYKPSDHKEVEEITDHPTANPTSLSYSGAGGFLSITAMSGAAAPCVGATVTGWAENDMTNACTVSTLLKSLYSTIAQSVKKPDTTPQLLERLAMSESSYKQFFPISLAPPKKTCAMSSPVSGLWPHENFATSDAKPGDFIGLMQVATSAQTAWNWIINANTGAKEFGSKIQTAENHRDKVLKQQLNPSGLSDLNGHQIEQLAIGLYKGFGKKKKPTIWYWVPQCSTNTNIDHGTCPGGTWSWQPNPKPCIDGTNSCVPSDPTKNVIVQVDLATHTAAPCEK